jgi:hypothetical protein
MYLASAGAPTFPDDHVANEVVWAAESPPVGAKDTFCPALALAGAIVCKIVRAVVRRQ